MKWVAIATLVLAPMFLLQSAAAQSCAGNPLRDVGGVKTRGLWTTVAWPPLRR
jgi:hypothetical protein